MYLNTLLKWKLTPVIDTALLIIYLCLDCYIYVLSFFVVTYIFICDKDYVRYLEIMSILYFAATFIHAWSLGIFFLWLLLPYLTLYMSNMVVFLIRSRNCLPFASTWVHPRFSCGICVAHMFSFLCCSIMCLYVLSSVLCYISATISA